MRILLATSEAEPFAKTGGLADVCGALPRELERMGHESAVILPYYRHARFAGQPTETLGISFIVPIGSKTVTGHLLRSRLPDSQTPVYLVQQDQYYDREQLYRAGDQDYIDNCERFVFFNRAVMESIRLLDLRPDVIHVNDWQTGLIPAYLRIEYQHQPRYQGIASLMTIHNMAFQGQFWHWDMLLTGLDWKYFNWRQMEFHGRLNLLKTGLVFADSVNTVSPTYAREIQTPEFGAGLEGVLQYRRDVLSGILNGIDTDVWNPATDPHLAARYTAETLAVGKAACKAALQEELGLPRRSDVPLVGLIGRLTDQKGLDLVTEVMTHWLATEDVQWAILGTGEPLYERMLDRLARKHPDKAAVRIDFSPALSHRMEAGLDIFLMPSRFEPCGLNQMYSLRYGTLPVVRATGGLADTVTDLSDETLLAGTANGFSFTPHSPFALADTLRRACDAYRRADVWNQLQQTGMAQDWSWRRSAERYVELYGSTLERARHAVAAPLA